MWEIQINWNGQWITVATGHKSQGDAEWATAGWKQANQCYGDPFRTVRQLPEWTPEEILRQEG